MTDLQFPVVLFESAQLGQQAYQAAQWAPALEALAEAMPQGQSPAIVCQSPVVYSRLRTAVPTFKIVDKSQILQWMHEHGTRLVMYSNRRNRDFWLLRKPFVHIQLGHGESDKPSSFDQIRAWDYAYVAGEAARERYRGLPFFDVDERCLLIGRPQQEVVQPPPSRFRIPNDERVTVLYAPTWEGVGPSARYSSLASHGQVIISKMALDPRFRIIFRPHDLTGRRIRGFKQLQDGITNALIEANRRTGAGHILDTPYMTSAREVFGWHLDAADAAVLDVSAVTLEWYSSKKPMVLCQPPPMAFFKPEGTWMETIPVVPSEDAQEIPSLLWEEVNREVSAWPDRTAWIERHFGQPGATKRFVDTTLLLLADANSRREALLAP